MVRGTPAITVRLQMARAASTYAGAVTDPTPPPGQPRPGWQPDFAPPPGPVLGTGPGPQAWPAPPVFESSYRHPGRPTGIRCQRCGRPICGECMVPAPVGFQCPDCVQTGLRESRQYEVARRRPSQVVTVSLMTVNLVLFALTFVTGRTASPLFALLALVPQGACERGGSLYSGGTPESCAAFGGAWLPGVADGAVWQLITSAFMHLDLMHIAFNMFALWALGPQLETFLGRARYLAVYLVSALGGAAFVMWLSPPTSLTVGASGAVFGLMGALLVIAWRRGLDVRNILFWVGANLVFTFLVAGISWQGHIGGLAAGLLAALAVSGRGRGAERTSWIALGVLFAVFLGASLVRMALL